MCGCQHVVKLIKYVVLRFLTVIMPVALSPVRKYGCSVVCQIKLFQAPEKIVLPSIFDKSFILNDVKHAYIIQQQF